MTVDAFEFFVLDKAFPHSEFVAGINDGSLKLVINDAIGDDLCTRKYKTTLGLIKGVLFLIPFIAVIAYSVYTRNWWFLFGIIVSWLASTATAGKYNTETAALLMMINIVYCIFKGFHLQDYFTFFSIVFIISSLFMRLQNEYDLLYVKRSLIEDESLFRTAIENDKITLVRPEAIGK